MNLTENKSLGFVTYRQRDKSETATSWRIELKVWHMKVTRAWQMRYARCLICFQMLTILQRIWVTELEWRFKRRHSSTSNNAMIKTSNNINIRSFFLVFSEIISVGIFLFCPVPIQCERFFFEVYLHLHYHYSSLSRVAFTFEFEASVHVSHTIYCVHIERLPEQLEYCTAL